jgi:predicted ATPase
MIKSLAVSGYRSLRNIALELGLLNLVTGPNGSGKSSLYRALRLLADIAQGRVIQSLAAEGGLQSTLWAGPETISRSVKRGEHPVQGTVRKNPVSLKLGFSTEDYGYAIDLGLPIKGSSPFGNDPDIKVESMWSGEVLSRTGLFAERRGPHVKIRGEKGEWRDITTSLSPFDSMLTHCADPRAAPELLGLRERMRDWRFYDQWRTDRDAPARKPQIGTYTPVLGDDGSDLTAAIKTIQAIGNGDGLDAAVEDAFPGATVGTVDFEGYIEIQMQQHGLLRPLHVSELSDGTLKYLFIVAALLTPRPPDLMVFNEPEASLHPDLLQPLARLIIAAAARSQIVVVSHSPVLVRALQDESSCTSIVLDKEFGETVMRDGADCSWLWPPR